MSDIFISYARSNEAVAKASGDALRQAGFKVWRDDELPAHRSYSEVIEERLQNAKAVLVLWSADAVRSQWVRAEADIAREAGTLVQMSVDGAKPPIPFNQIQCADLAEWSGNADHEGWKKVLASVGSLVGPSIVASAPAAEKTKSNRKRIIVLPFQNMSDDSEQEYFSDGISEDIITDLSKVSSLDVVSRNQAFSLKKKEIDIGRIGEEMAVSHVVEGSVRKAGGRVRITAQLTDASNCNQIWAERYDRELEDIFALQDEISKAIVSALRLKLLPKEKKAIEHRGTSNSDAYNLYLMARQRWVSGNEGDIRRDEVVVRICRQAVALDPGYAKAWALMSLAQAELHFRHDREEDALSSAEQALSLDPDLAEAYCVKARYVADEKGDAEEAKRLTTKALELGPDSWEVNKEVARQLYRVGDFKNAIPYFEKAAELMDSDYHSVGLASTAYAEIGDQDNLLRVSRMTLERAEKAVAQEPSNGSAIGMGAVALAMLGEKERTKEWIQRALLIDPDNITMRYNLTCALVGLQEYEAAVDLIEPSFLKFNSMLVTHIESDPDMAPLRGLPRFQQLVEDAKTRVAASRKRAPPGPGPTIG